MDKLEKLKEAKTKAIQNLEAAEHLLFMSYPVLRNNRLLASAAENMFLSMTNSMAYVLYNERILRRIPPFHENYESKLRAFISAVGNRVSEEHIKLMEELKTITVEHKNSQMEFSRKEGLVICSDNYRTRVISSNLLKEYAAKARAFLKEAENLVKNERN